MNTNRVIITNYVECVQVNTHDVQQAKLITGNETIIALGAFVVLVVMMIMLGRL